MGNNTGVHATQAKPLEKLDRLTRRNRTARFIFEAATLAGYGFQTNGVDELVIVFPPPSRLPQDGEAFRSFQQAIHAHALEIVDLTVKHGRRRA